MATKRTPRRRVWSADDDPVAAALGMARSNVDGARSYMAHARRDGTSLVRLAIDVHEARKALKRARAQLSLVAPIIGVRDARRLGRRCRAAGRLLAPGRDATVAVGAFEIAIAANGDDEALAQRPAVGVEALLTALMQERDDALGALRDGSALADAGAELRALRTDLAAIRPKRAGAKAWAKGLERMHRRARRAALRALAAPDDGERAHVARGRWKGLGYVLRGYESAWPAQIDPLAATVEAVCEGIGDQHDALVLIERLGRVPDGDTSEAAAWVAQRAWSRAATLLASALPVLERLAAEPSDGFAERHRGYLEAARSAAHAAPGPGPTAAETGAPP